MQQQADVFAKYVRQSADTAEKQVHTALSRVMQRTPSAEEVAHGLELMESLKTEHRMNDDQTLKYFCLLALNLNEFMYLD